MFLGAILFSFLLGMLMRSDLSKSYALLGLEVWSRGALPSLFPFMLLSGTIIRMNLAEKVAGIFHVGFNKLFRCSRAATYVIFVGFLCGFPMGARTIAELMERKALTKEEGRWLLAFCNHLGPAFLTAVALPILKVRSVPFILMGQYGIPFLYGMVLRHTLFRGLRISSHQDKSHEKDAQMEICEKRSPSPIKDLPEAIFEAVKSSVSGILILGGYVVFFTLLNLIPHLLLQKPCPLISPLFEITSGIMTLGDSHKVYSLTCLSFGGISCLAQTYCSLQNTELREELPEYFFHKCILTGISFLYYSALSFFSFL